MGAGGKPAVVLAGPHPLPSPNGGGSQEGASPSGGGSPVDYLNAFSSTSFFLR